MSTFGTGSSNLFGFLETLLLCSEKAATIARMIKLQYEAFQSLVQQKCITEANSRFDVDVKTLADVLIQEVIRFDLEKMVRFQIVLPIEYYFLILVLTKSPSYFCYMFALSLS